MYNNYFITYIAKVILTLIKIKIYMLFPTRTVSAPNQVCKLNYTLSLYETLSFLYTTTDLSDLTF